MASRWVPPRTLVLVTFVGALASAAAGWWAYGTGRPDLAALQLAADARTAASIVGPSEGAFRDALAADYRLIAGYTLCQVLVLGVGWQCLAGPRARRAAGALAGLAVLAGLLDVGENLAVTAGLDAMAAGTEENVWWLVASGLDVLKLTLLLPTSTATVVTLLLVTRRTLPRRRSPECRVVAGSLGTGRTHGYLPQELRDERPPGRTGLCVSGGGIRSACVTLGALQVLRDNGHVRDDGYLFSVSGGGYTTGALRLAMQPTQPSERARPLRPRDAYAPGTPEFEFMRAHGNYVASGVVQWCTAFGVVLVHLVYALFLLTAVSVALGLGLGLFYGTFQGVAPWLARAATEQPEPSMSGVSWLLGVLIGVAVLLWLVGGAVTGRRGEPSPLWESLVRVVAALTVAVASVTVLVPALVLLISAHPTITVPTLASGGGSALVASIATMLFKVPAGGGRATGLGAAVKQYAGVVVVVAVIAVIGAAMLVATATTIREVLSPAPTSWLIPGLIVGVAVAAIAAVSFDQTRASLHPFYRRRLNSLYSRRVGDRAQPYDFGEPTDLTTHATKVEGYPEFVFVATAQIAAPGGSTRPVPYTFSSDWVGGAQVGYVRTAALVAGSPRCYGGDLTLLGAVALSGAAFASAMGVMSMPFEVLLALTNARLGAWLPNLVWLERDDPGSPDWTRRRLPAVRSEAYHVREVLSRHPVDDPLVLVTDGGHYDNLGLVEALRHRCTTVIVVDSSNDPPPYPDTLIDALATAEEELGVTVEHLDLDVLSPGSIARRDSRVEPLASLRPRLSAREVVSGTIQYPAIADDVARTGTLVVVKARLTKDSPERALSYAAGHAAFPCDPTTDQWFDDDQFEAYHVLGRHLGGVAVKQLAAQSA